MQRPNRMVGLGFPGLALLMVWAGAAVAEPAKITRQVLLPNGKPAVGVKVTLHIGVGARASLPDEFQTREVSTITDERGAFTVETQQNGWDSNFTYLMVDAPRCALGFWNFWNGDRPLQLAPDTGIQGKVVGGNNEAIAGATVMVTMLGTDSYVPLHLQGRHKISVPALVTQSANDGTFRLRSTSLQNYFNDDVALSASAKRDGHVWVYEGGRFDTKSTSSQPSEITARILRLVSSVSVHGRVVDDATDRPLHGARVEYSDRSRLYSQTRQTDENGRFAFEDLLPGVARSLIVTHPNYPDARTDAGAEESRVITAEQLSQDVELRLARMARVGGKVVDSETGQPLPFNITVRATQTYHNKDGWRIGSTGAVSTGANSTGFAFSAPTGKVELSCVGGEAMETYHALLQIPVTGVDNLVIKTRRRPGYLVQFKHADESQPWFAFDIYQRTPDGEKLLSYRNSHLFFPAQTWGETMEIRGVGDKGKEIFGWTKIAASRELQPTVITFS